VRRLYILLLAASLTGCLAEGLIEPPSQPSDGAANEPVEEVIIETSEVGELPAPISGTDATQPTAQEDVEQLGARTVVPSTVSSDTPGVVAETQAEYPATPEIDETVALVHEVQPVQPSTVEEAVVNADDTSDQRTATNIVQDTDEPQPENGEANLDQAIVNDAPYEPTEESPVLDTLIGTEEGSASSNGESPPQLESQPEVGQGRDSMETTNEQLVVIWAAYGWEYFALLLSIALTLYAYSNYRKLLGEGDASQKVEEVAHKAATIAAIKNLKHLKTILRRIQNVRDEVNETVVYLVKRVGRIIVFGIILPTVVIVIAATVKADLGLGDAFAFAGGHVMRAITLDASEAYGILGDGTTNSIELGLRLETIVFIVRNMTGMTFWFTVLLTLDAAWGMLKLKIPFLKPKSLDELNKKLKDALAQVEAQKEVLAPA